MKVDIAFDVRNMLGEGPVYDDQDGTLIWFDILNQTLFIGTPQTGDFRPFQFDEPVSAAFLGTTGQLLMAGASGLFAIDKSDGLATNKLAIEADNPITRANDSRVAPGGSIWFGTMGRKLEDKAGAIYHLQATQNGIKKQTLFDKVSIPNATCFSPDGQIAYFCDTPNRQILQVQIDPQTALPIASPSVFADLGPEQLNPDGAVIDSEGCLWNAQWGAGRIACYGPDGQFRRDISLPASQITCPCFGGADFKTLFATSAYEGLDRRAEPLAGAVFAIEMDVAGLPERRTQIS